MSITVSCIFALQFDVRDGYPPLADKTDDITQEAKIGIIGSGEVSLIQAEDIESFDRDYPQLPYYVLEIGESLQTPAQRLYGETAQPKFDDAVNIPILVTLNPPTQMLMRYGIEETVAALGVVSNAWVAQNMPNFHMKPGDRLAFAGIPLEVKTVKEIDYLANTQITLHTLLTLGNAPTE